MASPGDTRLIRVLHVEADADLRGLMKQRLQEADPELLLETVSNPVDAIRTYEQESFDCVLIGHSPIIDSSELSRALGEHRHSKAPLIVYTKEDEENIVSRVFEAGVDAYLIIGRSMDQASVLARRIKVLVERRRGEDLALAITNSEKNAVVVELGDKIIYVNSAFELLVSRALTEILGQRLTSFTIVDERPGLQLNLRKGGESNLTIMRPDGSQRRCRADISKTQLLGEDASVVVIDDITEFFVIDNHLRSILRKASELLTSRSLDELSRKTLDAVEASFDSEVLSFMIVEGDELVCIERRWRANGLKIPISSSNSMARAVREGKAIGVGDFSKEPELLEETKPRSGLSLPVKIGESVVAVIDLRSSKKDAFTESDVEILSIFSIYVGGVHKFLEEIRSAASSETQYRRLLDMFNDAVFVLDDSHYLYVNKRGVDLLGYSDYSEIIGTDVYQHVAPDFREMVRSRVKARLNGENVPSRYDIRLVKRDGSTIDVEVDASLIMFEGKPASLAIEKDVTALKQTQDQIKKHTAELEQQVEKRTQELLEAEQFAAAGRMASMVGHDLRSPLQSIKNASYLIRRQPERSEEMLGSIDSSVDRALAMLEELRHQTRETPLKLEAIDLPGMIVDILKQTPVEENVVVDIRLDPALKVVEIDPLKVRRVLENLVRNALEAMPNGGRLTVETKLEGGYFVVSVIDTGVGIPREQLPNLFRPFFTTKSKGLGLGLAYSQKAAEDHGGLIEVESEVGKGTTFRVRLPNRTPQKEPETIK